MITINPTLHRKISFYLLFALPMVFGVIGVSFNSAKFANDPDYIYLMNGLNIIRWMPVGHVDNPGTPVMELSAAVILVKSIFSPGDSGDIVKDVLSNPAPYVATIRVVLVLLCALALLFAGFSVFRSTGNLADALLVQITPFLSVNLMDVVWTKVSPEPLLFFTTIILSALLIRHFKDDNDRSSRYVWFYALLSGFGMATKATFLPLLIIPFVVLKGWKNKLLFMAGTVIAFFIFIIPAIPALIYMYEWFENLVTHSGVYGQGEKNIIDVSNYTRAVRDIFINNKIFTFFTFTAILFLLSALVNPAIRRKLTSRSARFLTALLLANLFSVTIVAKHYHQNHYLIPALTLTGTSLYFLIVNLSGVIRWRFAKLTLQVSFLSLLAVLIFARYVPAIRTINYWYEATNLEAQKLNEIIEDEYGNHKRIYYFPNSLNVYSALAFGNAYSASRHLSEIKTLYPDVLLFNSYKRTIIFWGAELSLGDVISQSGDDILLIGGPMNPDEAAEISRTFFPLQSIFKGYTNALYAMDKNALEAGTFKIKDEYLSTLSCDLELMSADKQNFLCRDYEISNLGTATSEMSRSGSNAVKLTESNAYSLGLNLKDAVPGKKFKVSVWRFSDTNEGVLVVSSEPEKIMYYQMGDFIRQDEKGWKLIELSFTVPENIGTNKIRVYVWNTGKGVVYFDDLTISSD